MKSMCKSLLLLLCLTAGRHTKAALTDTFHITGAARKLQPHEEKYIQYTETKDGLINFNSILTRKIERTTYNGADAFLIIQTYQTGKAIDKDSSYCDVNTLMPLAYFTDIQSTQPAAHQEKVIFSNGTVDNTILFKDSMQKFTKSAPEYYNGVMADDFIPTLPLQEKKQFVFKALNPGAQYFEFPMTIDVEGKEEVSIPGAGKVMCWRIQISTSRSSTLQWYTVKGCRQVKKKFVFKNGNIFMRVAITS